MAPLGVSGTMIYYVSILVLSFLPLVSIFVTTDLFHSHDGLVHIPRIAAYYKALLDLQIPVRWAGDLNYGYGMPLFNFIYQLPYFIASIFLLFGFGLVHSFKVTLALSYILSGIFMLMFARLFFKDAKKAFLVSVFYQFAPFRLVELLIRGSFGEVYTYAFLPLVLFGLTRLFKNFSYQYMLLTTFASALLILSHNSISLVFFGICAAFVIFFSKSKKNFLIGITALILGLMLSSFYWIPALFEHKYTYGDLYMKNVYLSHFVPFPLFFVPNFTNNPSLYIEKIPPQLGIFHVIALFLFFLALVKKIPYVQSSSMRRLFVFCSVLTFGAIFFMTSISKFLWGSLSVLRQFQFPWRFLAVTSFTSAICSTAYRSVPLFRKKFAYVILIALVVASTAYYWRPQEGYDKVNESYYWNFPLNTTYYGETDVVWSAGPAKSYPKSRVEVIDGEGKIENVAKKSNLHTFTVSARTNVKIVDHTQYFPGWRVYVDGKQGDAIEFQDPNWRGLITFRVPKGEYDVKVAFGESRIRLIADIISLSTLVGLVLIWFLKGYTLTKV